MPDPRPLDERGDASTATRACAPPDTSDALVATGRRCSAQIPRPGRNPPPSTAARTPVTDPCSCAHGPSCILRSTTTQEGAAAVHCPSWSVRSSSWRSSVCPGARVGGSLGFCGCGGTVLEGMVPDLDLIWRFLRKTLRPGTHLPLPQAEYGMDARQGSPPRTGRPVELAGHGRLHAAKVGARACCGP